MQNNQNLKETASKSFLQMVTFLRRPKKKIVTASLVKITIDVLTLADPVSTGLKPNITSVSSEWWTHNIF